MVELILNLLCGLRKRKQTEYKDLNARKKVVKDRPQISGSSMPSVRVLVLEFKMFRLGHSVMEAVSGLVSSGLRAQAC